MGMAFVKIASPASPTDSIGGWPTSFPWPYPYPPYDDPDPYVPYPPTPPKPPGNDDDDTPPNEPDENGDTYRFAHIVKSIDDRLSYLGETASGLSTVNPDRLCTYDNINSARDYIENFYDNFVKNPEGKTCIGTSNPFPINFEDYHDLLKYSNVGVIAGGATEWYNLNSNGVWYGASDMASTDQIHPVLFSELEAILQKLVLTSDRVVSKYTTPFGGCYSYDPTGWPNGTSNPCDEFAKLASYSGYVVANGWCSIQELSSNSATPYYYYRATAPRLAEADYSVTAPATSSTNSLNRNMMVYSGVYNSDIFIFDDLANTGLTETFSKSDETGWTIDTTSTLSVCSGTCPKVLDMGCHSISGLEYEAYQYWGINEIDSLIVVEWEFPSDASLGSLGKGE